MKKTKKKNTLKLLSYKIVIGAIGVLAIGAVALAYIGNAPKVVVEGDYIEAVSPAGEQTFGGAVSQDHYFPERFWAGFGGGALATTTTATAVTLREYDLTQYSIISVEPQTAALTYTLPATTTLTTLLKNQGDTQKWIFHNATTTAAISLTVAKGTGWNLVGVDANVDVIAGAAWGSSVYMGLNCTRQPDTDIVCFITDNIAVD